MLVGDIDGDDKARESEEVEVPGPASDLLVAISSRGVGVEEFGEEE